MAAATDRTLQTVEVSGERDADAGFAVRRASASTTKSDTPLFETPQSVSVLTRDLLDSRQAVTLNEAIQATAGVSAGSYGRTGWDTFVIRGQMASESIYVDGLKLGQSNWIAQEVYGVERVEVVKGPASINFGLVQPGGLVNMVSKRPLDHGLNQAGLTVGSYGYRQASFDLGRPLSASGKAAFRINGMASNQDDPTDHVYFRSRYLAPSLSLDFGPDTDFTLLAALNQRKYIRQQGVPVTGTLRPNGNGPIDRARFVGDPGFGPYDAEQRQLGYALERRFDSGWKLRQNFRWQGMDMYGPSVQHAALQANQRLQNRSASLQQINGHNLALDTNLARSVVLGGQRHELLVGLDWNRDRINNDRSTCRIGALDLYAPVYNTAIVCPATPTSLASTNVSYRALYLRDQIRFGQRLHLNLAARHDRVTTEDINRLSDSVQRQKSRATTGNAALLYQVTPNVAPYISYATSFLPVGGTDFFDLQFKPEKGRQAELGAKFQYGAGRINGAVALYDLTRENVTTADPDAAHLALMPSARVQTGEQRSKGLEAELSADLRNGWSLQAALTFADARLTRDNSANVGKVLLNVPRRSASLWANYKVRGGVWNGVGGALGLRHESAKSGPAVNYEVPAYTVADANLSYRARGYRLLLNVKNLFDRDYFAGAVNNNVLALGDPRTVMLKAVVDF